MKKLKKNPFVVPYSPKLCKINNGFGYQLKKDYYNYKMFYITPMITIKKIPIEETQKKMRKE